MIVFERLIEGEDLTLTYRVKEDELIDSVILGMLKNNSINGIVPVEYQQIDENRQLVFKPSLDRTVSYYLSKDKNHEMLLQMFLLKVFEKYVGVLDKLKEYLLPPAAVVLDDEYMYTNQEGELEIICVPIETMHNITDKECMLMLLEHWKQKYGRKYQGICQVIQKWITVDHLSSHELLFEIQKKEMEWKEGKQSAKRQEHDGPIFLGNPNQVILGEETKAPKKVQAYLFHKNANKLIEIDKEYFSIGQLQGEMSYVIKGNMTISKRHAAVVQKEERFYIVDTYSRNHVHLNGRKIDVGTEVLLRHNDVIRLANEEFVFEENQVDNVDYGAPQ